MPRLSLYIMGPPRIELDGVAVKLDSRKATALLITLALTAQSHPRDALINLLWPDYDAARGHLNLRHSLYLLRKSLTGDWLQADRESIRLNPAADVWLDLHQFHGFLNQCFSHGHAAHEVCPACISPLDDAITLYRGDFLSGFSLQDSLEFDDWQLFQTENLRREVVEVLERLVRYHLIHANFEVAIESARRWLALDCLSEEVHCHLMLLYALSGQRSTALRQYQECARLLQDELGIPPQAATTALYQAIVKGELAQMATSPPHAPQVTIEALHQNRHLLDTLALCLLGKRFSNQPAAATQVVQRLTQLDRSRSVAEVGWVDSTLPLPTGDREIAQVRRRVFVAREDELARLYRRVEQAVAAQGQVVFITGDAGRGKTALLQEFTQRAQARWSDLVVAGGNCNAYTGEGDPYLPFREILGLLTGDIDALWTAGSIQHEHARRLWDAFPLVVKALIETAPDLLDTFIPAAALLRRTLAFTAGSLSEYSDVLEPLQRLVEQKNSNPHDPNLGQSALFEQYVRVLTALSRERPLLLALDDLQWVDAASIGLLFHLGRRLVGQRILIIGAYRSEEVTIGRRGERHPLEIVLHEMQRTFGDIFIDLEQSEERQFVDQYLETEPNHLSAEFRETLYQKTRGHPLFTVELLRGMQERGDLVKDAEGYWVEGKTLNWSSLPGRVEAVIAERIARLDALSREVLEIASVEGETFTAEVVARVSSKDEQEIVKCLSAELNRRHHLVRAQEIAQLGTRRLSRYRFLHILYQNYLYRILDPVVRVYLHEAVGTALETLYGKDAQEIAVPLARHFREAGRNQKAIEYLLIAGQKARQSSANAEAISYLTQGLELIKTLSDTPERSCKELEYRLTLGVPQVLILGHAADEVEMNYLRARELSTQTGDAYQRFQALMGLRRFYHVRGNLVAALEAAEQILVQARHLETIYLSRAHVLLGEILYRMGSFQKAQEHYEQSALVFEAQKSPTDVQLFGNDTLVISQVFQGVNLWQLGFPDQALKISQEGIARAQQLSHSFTLVCGLNFAAELDDLRREPQVAQQKLEILLPISRERGFALYTAWGTLLMGHVLLQQNRVDEGIALMQQGLAAWRLTGARLSLPGFLSNLAEAYWKAGKYEEGSHCIDDALTVQAETGEHFYEAELYRFQGELIQAQGDQEPEAGACFQRALRSARTQNAQSWELRAALSLGRFWHKQGKNAETLSLLAGILNAFTEGFDTPDLQEAVALLEQVKQAYSQPV